MDIHESEIPNDAMCPGCGVALTKDNVFHRWDGTAGAVAPTEVPGVVEEDDDVPIYVLQCVDCTINNRQDR
jgi:hypothetical protein